MAFTLFGILFLAFISFRVYLLKKFAVDILYSPSSDSALHLLYFLRLRKGKRATDQFLLNDREDYPLGYHKLIGLLGFSPQFIRESGGFLNLILDCLAIGLVAFSLWFLNLHYYWASIFVLSRLFYEHAGRLLELSERPFGVLFGNAYLFGLIIFLETNNPYFLVVSIISGGVVFTSSKFAIQAIAFISLFIALFHFSFLPVLLFLATFLISVILSAGYSFRVVKGLIRHSIFYNKFLVKKHIALKFNHFDVFLSDFKSLFRDPKSIVSFLMARSLYAKLFYLNVLLVPSLGLMAFGRSDVGGWAIWLISSVLVGILISFEKLKFLGEPERYLEFSVIPATIVCASTLSDSFLIVFVGFSLVALIVWLRYQTVIRKLSSTGCFSELLDEAKVILEKKSVIVLTIPSRMSFNLACISPSSIFLNRLGNIGGKDIQSEYQKVFPQRTYIPSFDLNAIRAKYVFEIVVLDKNYVKKIEEEFNTKYDFDDFINVFENEDYALLIHENATSNILW